MARTIRNRKGTGRKTFSILVDGETEKWYLDTLRSYENPIGLTIKPELPQRKTLAEQFAAVKRNAEIYDVSIWIVDLDVIVRHGQEGVFNKYLDEIASNTDLQSNILVLINTPSLEFWLLQHVKDTGKYYPDCVAVIAELKKHPPLKEYAKTEKYFIRCHPNIYERLRPHLRNALTFARKRGSYDPANPRKGLAELYKLFELLGIAV